ncbi:adenosylcobinamide-GDP ribazoletransferase [Lactobacillus mulieris]|uniref:Adenosylcobinamide-GDP ribazoletransferase n=1 Tax=Lactobacillus mulieris TaxID=2508708 RepID=A0AAW5WWM5_9LACO|nr:adenosylcobinamide-GDP ribazoletransferase [Lactobacillus mulieris]MCZ3621445.1 adenosylcobinamide-GDP ribazoletransferase [Lactobacillus mulieris]MCZ3623279.1 adenosylcobinamide-GDP ribazoletransferase [Lactobacillus mulieris]MCZ3635452.1 adenosylcobinamide-GDP ribazoletransferase [Lactobacillus mulieris]MCZ3689440.1 adenosylcobinamide-GDP ribazoletransferase [Lactobacillus mulieris]MCZ3695443.1 adenosylcobinamide-GDP ribazoletransferase [Lactobacillus mulieris]
MTLNQYQVGHLLSMILLTFLMLNTVHSNILFAGIFLILSVVPSYFLLGQTAKKKFYLAYLQMLWDIVLFSVLYFIFLFK